MGSCFIFIFVLYVSRVTPLFILLFALFPSLCFEIVQGVCLGLDAVSGTTYRELDRRGPGFLFEL